MWSNRIEQRRQIQAHTTESTKSSTNVSKIYTLDKRRHFQKTVLEKLEFSQVEERIRSMSFTLTKISSKLIKDHNWQHRNPGCQIKTFLGTGISKDFLKGTTGSQEAIPRFDKWDCMIIKSFYTGATCGGGHEPARGWDWRTGKGSGADG